MFIKWKEKYDAEVEDCHHSMRLCGDRMKKSLPKKKKKILFFFRVRLLPFLPESHLRRNSGP